MDSAALFEKAIEFDPLTGQPRNLPPPPVVVRSEATSRPVQKMHFLRRNRLTRKVFDRPGVLGTHIGGLTDEQFERLPDHIKRKLTKPYSPFGPRGSGLGWEEVIANPNASGTAVTAAAETILLPDFSIPASYLTVGKVLKYTLMGQQSTAITTPGTITQRIRWGGVAGVSLAASGAFAPDPTAAATNLTWMIEWWIQCRSVGATGTALAFGRVEWSDYDDASSATVVGNLNMRMAPTSAPAVATIDTTIDKLLSVTYTSSVATASCQALFGILEACN